MLVPFWLVIVTDIVILIGGMYIGTRNPRMFDGWTK